MEDAEKVATFMHAGYSNILRRTEGGRKKTTTENQRFSVVFYGLMDPSVIRLELDNIVVTKSFSEYCNATLSVVHELYTALFQCSSPLFPLGMTKIRIILEFREYMVIEWKRLSIF